MPDRLIFGRSPIEECKARSIPDSPYFLSGQEGGSSVVGTHQGSRVNCFIGVPHLEPEAVLLFLSRLKLLLGCDLPHQPIRKDSAYQQNS